jgi:hypothetical protein
MLGNPSQNLPLPYGNSGEWSGITQAGAGKFPNPFFDIASEYVPRNLRQIFEWAEYIYLTYGTYRSAARKVVRYFLTELVLAGESEDERDQYQDFLDNKLHMLTQLASIGDDYMVYGNVFVSIYFPFDRFLICPNCNTHYHIDTVPYKWDFRRLEFRGTCKKCDWSGAFNHEDIRSMDHERVRIIRWNPKRIKLRVHDISGEIEYYYEPDPRFVRKLREGNRFYLNDTPWSIIECCAKCRDTDQPLFQFSQDQIYHMKEATLAGLPIKGWAIPPILPNFKLAYYIQVLRRYDEAIALDYIVPFRILYPEVSAPGGMNSDPLMSLSMDIFVGHMKGMVAAKRANATDVQIAPFKIGYEMLGGEANQLAPKDNIAQALDELLNAVGFPAELYKGSLSIQAFPVALRLFEKTWGSLVEGYNDLIDWTLTKISRYFGWGAIGGALRSVTLADDIERKALALQAAAGMDISKGTAYKPLGIDYLEEQEKVVEEQKEIQQLQQEAMEEQEAAQYGAQGAQGAGQAGAPGGMAGPGGAAGATPGDVHAQAKELAYQLVTQTPETMRRGELIKIKHSNPTLHALVLQEMDTLRADLARQGQAMMLSQMKTADDKGVHVAGAGLLPSPLALGLLISSQVMDYTRADMRKMAMDIEIPGVKQAFRFVRDRLIGLA